MRNSKQLAGKIYVPHENQKNIGWNWQLEGWKILKIFIFLWISTYIVLIFTPLCLDDCFWTQNSQYQNCEIKQMNSQMRLFLSEKGLKKN